MLAGVPIALIDASNYSDKADRHPRDGRDEGGSTSPLSRRHGAADACHVSALLTERPVIRDSTSRIDLLCKSWTARKQIYGIKVLRISSTLIAHSSECAKRLSKLTVRRFVSPSCI